MSVLRRPPPALSKFAASARFKKLGAAVTMPNDANVMLPDLIKYLLSMILNLDKLLTVSCTLTFVRYLIKNQSTKYKALSTIFIAFETLAIPKSIPPVSQPDYRSMPRDC